MLLSQRRRAVDIWPGFVDALAALLMVVIFVLLLFSVGQFVLTDALVGRDRALDSLRAQIAELSNVLALEKKDKTELQNRIAALSTELAATINARDELAARLQDMTLQAEASAGEARRLATQLEQANAAIAAGEARIEEQHRAMAALEAEQLRLEEALTDSRAAVREQESLTEKAQTQVNELNAQIVALREQLAAVSEALDVAEAKNREQTVQIEDLGRRLNIALAQKVEELEGYRSEFFGKLREALKDNPDISIEGDRFVLPSGVLFASASAELDARGRREIAAVARTLQEIAAKIPADLEWVLRVDGHTDRRPIREAFPSNWELSTARATNIVKFLIQQGIPPEHLVAAGFAQFHPLDPADTPQAYSRNRRIELKLTSR